LIWAIVVGGILAQSYYGDVSNSTTIAQIKIVHKHTVGMMQFPSF